MSTPPRPSPGKPLACVEVGGSSVQTVVFESDGTWQIHDGAVAPAGSVIAMAVPGLIEGTTVRAASSLRWVDVDPADALGLPAPAALVSNDAEAAAVGEWALRGDPGLALVYVGVGTGVGGAVVRGGRVVADNLFGHATGFSDRPCLCGRTGCLETVAAGWALPDPLPDDAARAAGEAIAVAVAADPIASEGVVVVTGGVAEGNPALVAALRLALPTRVVEGSRRPAGTKSAAAWGLRHQLVAATV